MRRAVFTFSIFILFLTQSSIAQIQNLLYAGPQNGGTNLEICYSVTNVVTQNVSIDQGKFNQISVLYGKAPLMGYFTEAADCLDLLNYSFSSADPRVDLGAMESDMSIGAILELGFEVSETISLQPGEELELFCLNWTIVDNACSDLVYWTFCDNDVADTYYNDTEVFPLGLDCTEGDPQQTLGGFTLPVEFESFSGTNRQNKNVIEWSTASEVNSESFLLQRSKDGQVYKNIYKTNIKTGTISQKIQVSPNPFSDRISFTIDGTSEAVKTVQIFNVEGRLLDEYDFVGNSFEYDTSALGKGMYQLIIQNEYSIVSEKLVKL